MFCKKCGKQLPDSTLFCTACGAPVKAPTTPSAPIPPPPAAPSPPADPDLFKGPVPTGDVPDAPSCDFAAPPQEAPPPQRRRTRLILAILIPALLLCAALGGFFTYRVLTTNRQYTAAATAGDTYLASGKYARAISSYQDALALKPKAHSTALSLAQSYLMNGDSAQAQTLLAEHVQPEASPDYAVWKRLTSIAQLEPKVAEVDSSHFPLVTVSLACGGDLPLTADLFTITEGGTPRTTARFEAVSGGVSFTYEADEMTGAASEQRSVAVTATVDGITFAQTATYDTPNFEPATLDLVTTDVSAYPTVRAYFRVKATATGESVTGLDGKSFRILERVQGGEYLARTVRSVTPLAGNAGLNIDLVADKSSSIMPYDMDKIKSVMTEFVNDLHYEVGDKAEVLAFDSIVQQMCAYTDDSTLLVNGINNMSTDGLTALYDAVYAGINHAALQGGARCVIAFTDGMDNMSSHTSSDVIDYANTQQVPVYIIGVGSDVEAYDLQSIAQDTGGRYWFIDDLYDLEQIFSSIYTEQKELYVVEYESDTALDAYLPRDLSVTVTGSGCRGDAEVAFHPVRTINDNGGVSLGTSRYELFQESLTWEQATQKCQELGGHLATITSQSEMDQLTAMADAAGVRFVWLGGYTSYQQGDSVFGHWVTGEDFSYQAWCMDEPSRQDQDGIDEWYIMLWNIPELGGWTWNDQRNDPAGVVPSMAPQMAYICEFEGRTD